MAATYSSLVGLAIGGKYEIRRVLGAGGMGVVCEAMHLDLGKRVAVKLIDKSMKESELLVARFRREARAAGQIDSEHIVDVFDVGADSRVGLYMVMEHLTGEDLQTRIDRDQRLDVKTAVMVGHQIARGLAKAHAANVVHRDLKPANVFLTQRDDGHLLVKLLDFGVSKLLLDDSASARITGSGTPIGTPLYMSPEQAEGRPDIDGRADIWSLGAVMYETLAGAPAFADRGSYHATIVGILASRPRLLHDVAPWVPPVVAQVVDAMLVHDRDARIPSAEAVTKRLLEAYPAVLPDGTGRHTAVIVSQATAAVDGTSDTEMFTASSMPAALRPSNSPGSHPSGRLPDPGSDPSLAETALEKPLTLGGEGSVSVERPSRGPRTEPMAQPVRFAPPSSSARGVALPPTPPEIAPLPGRGDLEPSPDTIRDGDMTGPQATQARSWGRGLGVAALVVAVAAISYFAGRHDRPTTAPRTASAPPPATTSIPSSSVAPSPSATVVIGLVTASAPASAPPVASTPPTSASAPRAHVQRKPAPPTVKAAAHEVPSEPKVSEPEPKAPSLDDSAP